MIDESKRLGGLYAGRGMSPEVKRNTIRENLLHLATLFGIEGAREEKITESIKMCEMINSAEIGVYAQLGNLPPARIKKINILMDFAYLEDPDNHRKEICAKMHSVNFKIVDPPSFEKE